MLSIRNWIEEFDRRIQQTEENRKNNPHLKGNYFINKLTDAIPLTGIFTYIVRKTGEEGAPRGIYEKVRFLGSTTLLALYTSVSSLLLFPDLINDMKKGLEIILS